jgi:hypothetical protein
MQGSNQVDDESFQEAFQLAGWLLAHQTSIAASGEVPLPLVSFTRDDLESAQLLAPRTDSDSYERQVIAGRIVLGERSGQFRSWSFVYDEDLGPAGKVLWVEVGGRAFSRAVTLAQRYVSGGEDGFRLVGDLELAGQELLPPELDGRIEACRWRYLVTEGATNHDPAGEQWPRWYAARDHRRTRLRHQGFCFAVPEGWIYRRTEEDTGWLIVRLLPWEERRTEPTVLIVTVELGSTLESFVAEKKAELLAVADEMQRAEICDSPVPSLPFPAACFSWTGGTEEGQSYRTEWVWLPTGETEECLVLCATSFRRESWESVSGALEAILASLQRERGEAP